MPFLYILRSLSTQKYYTGTAEDVSQRVGDHNRGQTPSTRNRGPWELVYHEHFETLSEARRRERQIKAWKSHHSIAQLVGSKK